jgi:hypothetical protein
MQCVAMVEPAIGAGFGATEHVFLLVGVDVGEVVNFGP